MPVSFRNRIHYSIRPFSLDSMSADFEVTSIYGALWCNSGRWETPPWTPILLNDEVHVWRIKLDLAWPQIERLFDVLTVDEREQVERFYFHKDRQRAIAARGALRDILSRYLKARPSDLRFKYGPYGKPRLERHHQEEPLEFNLSHSEGLALIGVSKSRALGVDLERVRVISDYDQIAERFFSTHEIAALRSLPRCQRMGAFFCCWTRKEAYIKAKGGGLSIPLDKFGVSLAPGEPARLLWSTEDHEAHRRWSLKELSPAPGYVGALALDGQYSQMKCWEWKDRE